MRLLLSLAVLACTWSTSVASAQDERPYLGITLLEDDDASTPAMTIDEVREGTAAANGGLRPGDVLLRIGNTKVESIDALVAALDGCEVGQTVKLKVRRGDEKLSMDVVLGARPGVEWEEVEGVETDEVEEITEEAEVMEEETPLQEIVQPGMVITEDGRWIRFDSRDSLQAEWIEAQQEDAGYLGVTLVEADGAVIDSVIEGTPADRAGLKAGDRIVALGDQRITSMEQLVEAIGSRTAGSTVTVAYRREGSDDLSRTRVILGSRSEIQEMEIPEGEWIIEDLERPEMEWIVDEEIVEDDEWVDEEEEEGQEHDDSRPGYLGVTLDSDSEPIVGEVSEGTAAARAGLQPGDRVLAVGDRQIATADDLVEAISSRRAGEVIWLTLGNPKRDAVRRVEVRLGSRDGAEDEEEHEGEHAEEHEGQHSEEAMQRHLDEMRRELEARRGDLERAMRDREEGARQQDRARQQAERARAQAEQLRMREEERRAREQALALRQREMRQRQDQNRQEQGGPDQREVMQQLERMMKRMAQLQEQVQRQGQALEEMQRALREMREQRGGGGQAQDLPPETRRLRIRRGDGGGGADR